VVFTIVDAGGGTTDIVTYQIKNTLPLELEREIVMSDGKIPDLLEAGQPMC
jgi:hypothetical protein